MNTQTQIALNERQADQVFEILYNYDLQWQVKKLPLFGPEGERTTSCGIFRDDTGNHLGTVGASYEPVQNSQLCELLVKASEGVPVDFSNGGQLRGGKMVYLQADLPDAYIGRGGVKRKLTALNSHDGSGSLAFGSSNTVVWCSNTWHMVYAEIEKYRHTANIHDRVRNAAAQIAAALQQDALLVDNLERMNATPLRDEMIEAVINRIFDIDPKTTEADEISTRKKNQIEAFADALSTEVRDQGKTLWALFNGVTRYTNHHAAPDDEAKRTEYLMAGTGYKKAILGFDECMKWIDENSEMLQI